jgi:uncharacterized membrane protein
MAFCAKCGAQVAEGAAFCPACGAAHSGSSGSPGHNPGAAGTSGIQENVAGLLAYALWWITGIIFLLTDKRPFVRFHAAQSIVLFGGLSVIQFVLGIMLGSSLMMGSFFAVGSLYALLFTCLRVIGLVLWILCMVKAYQGERFKLPFVGDIAENIAGK